jgi:hypothetical protein
MFAAPCESATYGGGMSIYCAKIRIHLMIKVQ